MKKYASKKTHQGKTAYRTPSRVRFSQSKIRDKGRVKLAGRHSAR